MIDAPLARVVVRYAGESDPQTGDIHTPQGGGSATGPGWVPRLNLPARSGPQASHSFPFALAAKRTSAEPSPSALRDPPRHIVGLPLQSSWPTGHAVSFTPLRLAPTALAGEAAVLPGMTRKEGP
jgi:hypothetical protein